jgi:hypothetical protein
MKHFPTRPDEFAKPFGNNELAEFSNSRGVSTAYPAMTMFLAR